MKNKTEFQNFCTELVSFIIKNEAYQKNKSRPEYKEIMNIILRRYSEYTQNHEKIVDNLERLKKYCRVTERAVSVIEKMLPKSKPKEIFGKNRLLFQEHIMPIGEALRQLNSLGSFHDTTMIDEIMDKLELILISSKEQAQLDGSTNFHYEIDGKMETGKGMKSYTESQKRLDSIGAIIHKDYENNKII